MGSFQYQNPPHLSEINELFITNDGDKNTEDLNILELLHKTSFVNSNASKAETDDEEPELLLTIPYNQSHCNRNYPVFL